MIDMNDEDLISLAEAANRLPRCRRGKKISLATLYRWSSSGCRGVRLETLRVGRARATSMGAIQRFCERLTKLQERRNRNESASIGENSPPQIDRELDAAGF